MIDDVLHDIPIEYRDRFARLLAQEERAARQEAARRPSDPRAGLSALRQEVEEYLATVKQVGLMVKLLDMDQAEHLARSAMTLLDHAAHRSLGGDALALVRAAVRYFVVEEEDEEITGVLGFDDDAAVMNAVARALGRTDLVVAFKLPE